MRDLQGQQFGRWTVISETRQIIQAGRRRYHAWCRCECGTERSVDIDNLKKKNHTLSCGCHKSEQQIIRNKENKYGKLPAGESAFNAILYTYKQNAAKKNREFSLTREEFRSLLKMNCIYCGAEPHNLKVTKGGSFVYSGIDRKDNNIGYIVTNCVSCCNICNKMKLNFTYQDFMDHIRNIYECHIKPSLPS